MAKRYAVMCTEFDDVSFVYMCGESQLSIDLSERLAIGQRNEFSFSREKVLTLEELDVELHYYNPTEASEIEKVNEFLGKCRSWTGFQMKKDINDPTVAKEVFSVYLSHSNDDRLRISLYERG